MPNTAPALPPALLKLISQDFIERLLTMQHRTTDRDQGDAWLAHDNFGDFYAASKHLFVVGYSHPELLVSAVIKTFVLKQVSALVSRMPPANGGGVERLDSLMTQALDAHSEALHGALKKAWHAEYADILTRNSQSVFR